MIKDHLDTKFPIEVWGQASQKGDYGVEIEVEGRNVQPVEIAGWQMHNEGSLRNGGVEFVTAGSCTRLQVSNRITALAEKFRELGIVPDPESYRTSTHIHLNVQKENLRTLIGLAVIFTIVEPVLLRLCGSKRDGNHFCIPSYDCGDLVDFTQSLLGFISYGAKGGQVRRGKYGSINYTRLTDLGTVEFRCFPMSVEPDRILQWVDWIGRIRDLARSGTDASYRMDIKQAQRDPVNYARSVFGMIPLPDNTVRELILYGCEQAYEISREVKRQMTAELEVKEAKAEARRVRRRRAEQWDIPNLDEPVFIPFEPHPDDEMNA